MTSHSPLYLSRTMWPFGSMYTRPSPCMRKACSTRSLYSAGDSSPIMSVRPTIRVLRFRQPSSPLRAILRCEEPLDNADAIGVLRERGAPTPGVHELSGGSLGLPGLVPVAGGCEVVQAPEHLVLVGADELEGLGE